MSGAALRVVLVAPVPQEGDQALARTLEAIAAYGWMLVGLIPPDRHRDALQLVLDGEADSVIAARAEYVPAVMFTGDLSAPGPERQTQYVQRTRVVPRSHSADRRTEPIQRRLAG